MNGPGVVDLVVMLAILAFFGIAAGYVVVCDRMIGDDSEEGSR